MRYSEELLSILSELQIQNSTSARPAASDDRGVGVFTVTQLDDELEGLRKEEQALEEMRGMISPEHWPRIYAMLKRIRERMRRVEKAGEDSSKKTAA